MSYSDTLLPAIISMADLSEKFDIVPEEVRDALSALGVRMMRGGTDADLTRWPARRVTTEPDGRTVIYEIPLIPDPEEVVVLTDALPNSWQDRLKRQQRMSEMLAEQASSEYQKSAAEVDSAYDALTAATDELGRCTDTMSNAPKTGDISKVREAKAAVAEAKQAVTDAEHIIDLLHGDDPAVQDIPVVQAEMASTQTAAMSESEQDIDFSQLATRDELIAAFNSHTGMDKSWFDNITHKPALSDARKVMGTGGNKSTPPLFCPYEVMIWLTKKGRKIKKPISAETGWRLLKRHFPRAYESRESWDPNKTD